MDKSIIPTLQKTFGDRPISKEAKQAFEHEHGFELEKDWLEFDDAENAFFLAPEIIDYKAKSKEDFEALGLGELEERIVEVLEQGKSVKWGKLALAMWLFFLFIVIYTVVQNFL